VGLKLAINLALLIAPAALGASRVWHFAAHQPAYEARSYPATAVDFLQEKRPAGPIYNQYGWGGYLIRRLYPDYRVYIDGRADVYGDEFMVESQRTYEGGSRWREVLDGRAVRTVIIRPHAPLATLLREDTEWQKIFEDQQAVIFTRPEVAASPAAGPLEHSALRP
jgi:hypothetical protein